MSEYSDLCDLYGQRLDDPDAIDNILEELHGSDEPVGRHVEGLIENETLPNGIFLEFITGGEDGPIFTCEVHESSKEGQEGFLEGVNILYGFTVPDGLNRKESRQYVEKAIRGEIEITFLEEEYPWDE